MLTICAERNLTISLRVARSCETEYIPGIRASPQSERLSQMARILLRRVANTNITCHEQRSSSSAGRRVHMKYIYATRTFMDRVDVLAQGLHLLIPTLPVQKFAAVASSAVLGVLYVHNIQCRGPSGADIHMKPILTVCAVPLRSSSERTPLYETSVMPKQASFMSRVHFRVCEIGSTSSLIGIPCGRHRGYFS